MKKRKIVTVERPENHQSFKAINLFEVKNEQEKDIKTDKHEGNVMITPKK